MANAAAPQTGKDWQCSNPIRIIREMATGGKGLDLSEIKRRADIRDVWAALGGGKLRGERGQAFWRKGDGYSVSLDANRGLWHDFVAGDGGDVVNLVRDVKQCSFIEAAEWLAHHTGVAVLRGCAARKKPPIGAPTWTAARGGAWRQSVSPRVARRAKLGDMARYELTVLQTRLRLGDAVLVDEYRDWRKRDPQLSDAMTRAGQRSRCPRAAPRGALVEEISR